MDKSFVISAAAVTHIGLVRSRNEDNLYFNGETLSEDGSEKAFKTMQLDEALEPCVFAVCDGMGGLNNGGLASLTCVECFKDCKKELKKSPDGQKCMLDVINQANSRLCDIIDTDGKRMGSTIAAIAFAGGQLTAANVGDTRIYRLRGDELSKLSVDHNEAGYLVDNGMISPKQAKSHPGRNRLTQHIGIFPEELVLYPNCVNHDDCQVGDIYIVCSDGLYSLIEDSKIISLISESERLEDAAKALCDEALNEGGKDNITLILAKVSEVREMETAEEEIPAQNECEKEDKPEEEAKMGDYVLKLLDIRKKGQEPYRLTPRLIMSRFIFALLLLSAVMCAGMYFLGETVF